MATTDVDEGKNDDYDGMKLFENKVEWISLLKEWDLTEFADMFKKLGWTEPIDWEKMDESDFQQIGLQKGHIIRFERCLKEYNQLKTMRIQTMCTDDFIFKNGASASNHSNIVDIRSGNPAQTTYVYLKHALEPKKNNKNATIKRVKFSYWYMVGFSPKSKVGPSFQLIAMSEEAKDGIVIYSSPRLWRPNFDDDNTVYSKPVQVICDLSYYQNRHNYILNLSTTNEICIWILKCCLKLTQICQFIDIEIIW